MTKSKPKAMKSGVELVILIKNYFGFDLITAKHFYDMMYKLAEMQNPRKLLEIKARKVRT